MTLQIFKGRRAKIWQILPVGPTSYGDSPYQAFSTYAGNPYMIDIDMLIEEGLLTKKDLEGKSGEIILKRLITLKFMKRGLRFYAALIKDLRNLLLLTRHL